MFKTTWNGALDKVLGILREKYNFCERQKGLVVDPNLQAEQYLLLEIMDEVEKLQIKE